MDIMERGDPYKISRSVVIYEGINCLPVYLLALLHACLPACLLALLHACLPACLPTCLPVCLLALLHACLPAFLQHLPARHPARLSTCAPACLSVGIAAGNLLPFRKPTYMIIIIIQICFVITHFRVSISIKSSHDHTTTTKHSTSFGCKRYSQQRIILGCAFAKYQFRVINVDMRFPPDPLCLLSHECYNPMTQGGNIDSMGIIGVTAPTTPPQPEPHRPISPLPHCYHHATVWRRPYALCLCPWRGLRVGFVELDCKISPLYALFS